MPHRSGAWNCRADTAAPGYTKIRWVDLVVLETVMMARIEVPIRRYLTMYE